MGFGWLLERGIQARRTIEGFSQAVLKGNCAVARGNQPIHRGNAARAGVYILRKMHDLLTCV